MRYVDTSILVAALTRESRTKDMQDWLAARPVETLRISDWTVTEFSAALSMKVRMQILTPHERATARWRRGCKPRWRSRMTRPNLIRRVKSPAPMSVLDWKRCMSER